MILNLFLMKILEYLRNLGYLCLDYRHAGIGGHMAWSTVLDERHRVPAGCHRFRFEFMLL